jgi:glycosyltransferase involved in cell wall biosynthesis
MRVLYLGANIRTRKTKAAAPQLRAFEIQHALEQVGISFLPFLAGDEVNNDGPQRIYSRNMKSSLPPFIHSTLRDVYEMYLDWRFFGVIETHLKKIKPDIIMQQNTRYGQSGVRLGKRYNIPVFLDDITPIWEEETHSDRSFKRLARSIRKNVFSKASGLIAVSPEMEITLRSEGVPSSKIHLVPNGVDCDLFNPNISSLEIRQRYGLEGKVVVGYVGGVQQYHRVDLLVQIASSICKNNPQIRFLLVGHDIDNRVENMARAAGVSDLITFTGSIMHSQVPPYLNAMDIAVLPSTLPYMSPMKIYEYMAMEKPIVFPNNNKLVEEVVVPNVHGLPFAAGDVESLQTAILRLASDPELRQAMGKEARKTALSKYTWEKQVQNLIKAFLSALSNPGNRSDETI